MSPPRIDDAELLRTLAAVAKHHGSRAAAAREMRLNVTTLKSRLAMAAKRGLNVPPPAQGSGVPTDPSPRMATVGKVAALLERSGIDLDDVGKVEKVRLTEWDGFSKDEDGKPTVTKLEGVSLVLSPKWATGPEWPVIAQAGGATVKRTTLRKPDRPSGWKVAAVLPDMQIGFALVDGKLVPTHDETALAVMLAVVEEANPDVIVMVGDNLDLPEFSRYRLQVAFQRTTQATIDRKALLCASLRARVRDECQIFLIAGNHEERLPNYILDNARAAFGLQRANMPESWPVLSVPHLCRFSEYGVTFLPGYPANVYWINDHLSVIHGNKVRTGGSTAHAYLPEIRHSVIYGHVHRIERAAVTRLTKDGPRTYHAACFGCLCRIDGFVPGASSGYDLMGRPLATTENWQQGTGIVEFQPGAGDFTMEGIEIWSGRARWRGKSYHAPEAMAEAV